MSDSMVMRRRARELGGLLFDFLATVGILLLIFRAMTAQAASYNFYFNNTEQGANSTASPSLNVQGKGGVKTEGDGELKSFNNNETPETESEPTAPTASTSTGSLAKSHNKVDSKFYASLGVWSPLWVEKNTENDDRFNYHPGDDDSRKSLKAALNFGYRPLKYLSFGAALSSFRMGKADMTYALEANLIPVSMDVFGMNDALDLGIIGGFWNLKRAGNGVREEEQKLGSFYTGARLALNFGRDNSEEPKWFVAAESRFNKTYSVAALGLGVKF